MATLLLTLVALLLLAGTADAMKKKNKRPPHVLMVVTNVGVWTPTTGPQAIRGKPKATGYWLAEFTHSYDVFKADNKWDVTIASPDGGLGPADPQGFTFYASDPVTQKYVNGSRVPLTENTVKLADVKDIAKYDAVFFVGGTGAMFDFPFSPHVSRVARDMWESNKVVSAVCHGPMALTNVTLSTGKALVDGKTVTGFSNAEEEVLGDANHCVFCWLGFEPGCNPATCRGPDMPDEYPVPRGPQKLKSFLLEDKLVELGAKYVRTAQDWTTFRYRPHVEVDGRLVTGQNPGAGRETAQAVVRVVNRQRACPKRRMDEHATMSEFCSPLPLAPTDPPLTCEVSGEGPQCSA